MVLLAKRRQRKMALDGASLLRNKREALMVEFMKLIRPLLAERRALDEKVKEALRSIALALGADGAEALRSAAIASADGLGVELAERRLWGVRLPDLKPNKSPLRSLLQRGFSPFSVSSRIERTAEDFEALVDAVLKLVPTEVKLKKMGQEIKKTTRRVNALEQKVIPELEAEIAYIRQTLEDRAREDTFRLKMLKRKKERRGEA